MKTADAHRCYARMEGETLIVGNALIERRWRIDQGKLLATSLRVGNREWIAGEPDVASLAFGMHGAPLAAPGLTTEFSADHHVEAPSFKAFVRLRLGDHERTMRFKLFPNVPAIGMRLSIAGAGTTGSSANRTESGPTGVETDAPQSRPAIDGHDVIDAFRFDFTHCWLTETRFVEQTDVHNELVFENRRALHPSERHVALPGNLFYLEHRPSGSGLAMLKLAPSPAFRPVRSDADLEIRADRLALRGHGIDAAGDGYEQWVIGYTHGHANRVAAIQALQQQIRPYVPGRDGVIVANTWGDRSRDAHLNEAFLLEEIRAGAAMGVDVQQIDDGWQKGITANSSQREKGGVWNGFWASDEAFWTAHPDRFPDGLEPVAQAAKDAGMQLGLWYAPDSSNDCANWQRDAEQILKLWKSLGVRHVKIDAIKMHSKLAEGRVGQFYDYILDRSAGEVVFDPDVTAEIRPGYWGAPHVGTTFVENRYTDWRNYWPHHTLRNLWKLSHHIHPMHLRMEFLNPARNADKYANDPLAPSRYSGAALFATVMMSSPLAWFEVSNTAPEFRASVGALVAVWKRYRDEIFQSAILPIGGEPDGYTWSGFCTHRAAGDCYAVVYRPLGGGSTFDFVPPRAGMRRVEWLSGMGQTERVGDAVRVSVDRELEYGFVRVVFD